MQYITSFNKSIKKLIDQSSNDKVLQAIEDFRRRGMYPDYYQALDSLGLKVRVEYLVQTVLNINDNIVEYIPTIKLHENNPINGKFGMIEFCQYRSIDKAYSYIAKEYIYRLMSIYGGRKQIDF